MTLEIFRAEIDNIDKQLKELFDRRLKVVEQVADYKLQTGDKILKPDREKQVILQFTKVMEPEDRLEFTSLIKKVMEVSRTHQYRRMIKQGKDFQLSYTNTEWAINKVCYQGLPGSYSEKAAACIFRLAEHYPVNTFEEVFLEIKEGNADAGILPLENITAGTIDEVYDLLIRHDLYINHSTIVKVDHCLAGIKGSVLEDITEVYSHAQAILQSQEFLKANGLTAVESSNTAVAAKFIAEQGNINHGAICSAEAAEMYGLSVLAYGINQRKENATKFIAISKKLIASESHNRVSIVFSCPHVSGSLASVLGIFGDYGINLMEIHSRPDGKNSWNYLFYVDFTGNLMDERIRALFYQLTEELPFVKILGSYESDIDGDA